MTGYHERQTIKWILVGVLPAVFLIVLVIVIIVCNVRRRFHFLWIPKDDDSMEWGTATS